MAVLKEPWEQWPDIWKSKAAFFTYLRGSIRRIWARYPAKLKWKTSQLVLPPKGYTGRAKKLGTCYYCSQQFAASHLEVDHVEQAGACSSWEEAAEFMHKLLDCNGNWVLACRSCHKVKSYAERMGISYEEAVIEKKVIEKMTAPAGTVVAFCQKYGYTSQQVSNPEKRRAALREIFTREDV